MSRREKSYCGCGQQKSEKKKRCWDCEDQLKRARKHCAYHRRTTLQAGSEAGPAHTIPAPREVVAVRWSSLPARRENRRGPGGDIRPADRRLARG